MNIIIDRASSRGHANHGWLNTYHTFSFANYFNPDRMQFGALRVLNDDTVLPDEGFGTGILHSEYNDSSTDNLEFLQIWVIPDRINTEPKYKDYDIKPLLKHNEISTFLAPETAISIMQQAWFSWAELDRGTSREYKFKGQNTGVYVFVVEGEVKIGDTVLNRRDGAGITDTEAITMEALQNSTVLLMEVAQ